MKQYKNKIISGVIILLVLAFAFWYGGDAPGLQGWNLQPEDTEHYVENYAVEAGESSTKDEEVAIATELTVIPSSVAISDSANASETAIRAESAEEVELLAKPTPEVTSAPKVTPELPDVPETAVRAESAEEAVFVEKPAFVVIPAPKVTPEPAVTAKPTDEVSFVVKPTPEVTSAPKVTPIPSELGASLDDVAVENGAEKSSENTGMVIYKDTGKDQYLTEAVPKGKPIPIEPQDAVITNQLFSCTLSVRCDTILENIKWLDPKKLELVPEDGIIFAEKNVAFYEGESVFNVLLREMKRNKIHMEFENTPIYNSAYIEGINNLYEFDCGELSGWMYKVNGWFPNYGCSRYQLKPGDKIEWVYTCDLGADVGGGYSTKNGR